MMLTKFLNNSCKLLKLQTKCFEESKSSIKEIEGKDQNLLLEANAATRALEEKYEIINTIKSLMRFSKDDIIKKLDSTFN